MYPYITSSSSFSLFYHWRSVIIIISYDHRYLHTSTDLFEFYFDFDETVRNWMHRIIYCFTFLTLLTYLLPSLHVTFEHCHWYPPSSLFYSTSPLIISTLHLLSASLLYSSLLYSTSPLIISTLSFSTLLYISSYYLYSSLLYISSQHLCTLISLFYFSLSFFLLTKFSCTLISFLSLFSI